ncbi:sulfite exporter TauE/SafE family protein [Desulfosediminicola flagellatus]|uniref:sulfite exporter TauE/SafE family protein n=1 Tax=Desulfosediminicola flagellatus TaxID=2569541 RepID=UPI0010AB8FB9|nr:sulfite exporter TauE/SafE family protein [Desulfosediminicola flagellatus]
MHILHFAVGLIAGVFSGFLGIGGGIILVPALLYFFGMTQHQAQGTTLAIMLPPVFFFAVWKYYLAGHVNIPFAVFASVGLTIGAYLGAHTVMQVPEALLTKLFGIILILVGVEMVLLK